MCLQQYMTPLKKRDYALACVVMRLEVQVLILIS